MKTQTERVFDELKKGWRDQIYFTNLKDPIMRLAARVNDLGKMGVEIKRKWVKGKYSQWMSYHVDNSSGNERSKGI